MLKRLGPSPSLLMVSISTCKRGISAPSGSASKDTSSMPQNWNMLSQSQGVARELIERDSKSNTKEKIPDHTRKPQERIPATGKYATVDPSIRQSHEARIRHEQEQWKQSIKGRGGMPAPNPENSLDYGMRRRVKLIDEDECKDSSNLGEAFEIGNLAMRR
jgi:hypothetical protein